jgi:hypothetical protein
MEPHWIGYVGMITGIVGAITGVAGAIMGYLGYRRSTSLKSLDLRLELRKAANNVQAGLSRLERLIEHANHSRKAVAAAKGTFGSGMMVKWKQDVEMDKNLARELSKNAPPADRNYDDLTPKELESKLVELHKLQVQIDELTQKYDAAVRADDEDRKHIREAAEARFRGK